MATLKSWRFWIGVFTGVMLAVVVTLAWLGADGGTVTVLVRNYSSAPLEPVSILLNDKPFILFDVPAGNSLQTSFKSGDASLGVAVHRSNATMNHVFGYASNKQYEIIVTDGDQLQASEHPKSFSYLIDMLTTAQATLHPGR